MGQEGVDTGLDMCACRSGDTCMCEREQRKQTNATTASRGRACAEREKAEKERERQSGAYNGLSSRHVCMYCRKYLHLILIEYPSSSSPHLRRAFLSELSSSALMFQRERPRQPSIRPWIITGFPANTHTRTHTRDANGDEEHTCATGKEECCACGERVVCVWE